MLSGCKGIKLARFLTDAAIEQSKDTIIKNLKDQVDNLTKAIRTERADTENLIKSITEQANDKCRKQLGSFIKGIFPFIETTELAVLNLNTVMKIPPSDKGYFISKKDLKKKVAFEEIAPFVSGVSSLSPMLLKELKNHGFELIKPKKGEYFDSSIHEAVETVRNIPDLSDGDIVSVLRNGLIDSQNQITLIPARVVVNEEV